MDIENCGVPSDLNSTELYGLIEQKLGEDGFNRGNLVVNVVVPFLDSYVPELGPNIKIWRARNYNSKRYMIHLFGIFGNCFLYVNGLAIRLMDLFFYMLMDLLLD